MINNIHYIHIIDCESIKHSAYFKNSYMKQEYDLQLPNITRSYSNYFTKTGNYSVKNQNGHIIIAGPIEPAIYIWPAPLGQLMIPCTAKDH